MSYIMATKINKDVQISNHNISLDALVNRLKTLETTVNNQATTISNQATKITSLENKQEIVLWDSTEVKISSATGSHKDISGMPNLSNYVGYNIKFYICYGNNTYNIEKRMRNASDWLFLNVCRDYTGSNDMWHVLFGFYNLNSTTWRIKTVHSYQVQNTTVNSINSDNYSWYLYRVTATKV